MNRNLFSVFLWKNLLFLRFSWLSLLTIISGCFVILVVYLRSTYSILTTPSRIYDLRDITQLKFNVPASDVDFIFYSPSNPFLDNLMENVRLDLQSTAERFKPFENSSQMLHALENKCKGSCFAINFEKYPPSQNGIVLDNRLAQQQLKFAISSTAIRISPKKRYVNDEEVNGIKEEDDYIRSGFFTLQHIIDINFIKLSTKRENGYEIELSSLPSVALETVDSNRLVVFGSMFAIVFSVILLSTFLVPLVEEKQDGIKEFLVIATPLNFLNGVTFFLVRLVVYIIFLAVTLYAATVYRALGIVPLFYVILLFLLYILSVMSYTYLMSVCFNSVFYAKVCGLLLMNIPYIFYLVKGKLSTTATFLFSTKSFMDGLDVFQIFTNKHRYFSYSEIFSNITPSSFNIFSIYLILIFQCLVYTLLYNYLSCIFPGPGGLKKPYLFFLKRSFYKKKNRNQYNVSSVDSIGDVAIIIQDLVKVFKTRNREICIANRLNMEIKDKRITVLLGHNGAGKTTTMNMIMGSVTKDSGKIVVCCERDVSSYRHLIGFCPQHSVFMHYMTCFQHLQFFAELRGKPKNEAFVLATDLLRQLKLFDKANEPGKNLSGGMKRRLSLGIAISGDTKVVILDEPSSGLDVESRRELWDILLELRKTKAVLVTTHHMEEAEVLGDTISILANGRLERTGSPMELKRKVGCGYILKLRTENFKEQRTLELIQKEIPTAKILNTIPPTVLISMPYAYKKKYSAALLLLEKEQKNLGISAITVTNTSLEDVFLNCAAEIDQVDSPTIRNNDVNIRIPYERMTVNIICWSQQFRAVLYKRFVHLQNEWLYSLLMFSLPFLSVGLAILLMHSKSIVESEDALKLNLQQIKEGTIYLRTPEELGNNFLSILEKEIHSYGIETQSLSDRNVSLTEELQTIQSNNLSYFLQNVIGAIDVEFSDNAESLKLKIFFSGNIVHSSVIMLNLVDNVILKYFGNDEQQIEVSYVPIRRITDINPSRLENYAAIVPIGLFFYMFFYVSLPYKETKTGFKILQAIPRLTYWFSHTTFDLTLHAFITGLLYFFQRIIMPEELYSNHEQLLLAFTFFFYGISYLPILYCMTSAFRTISTLSTYLLFMLIISAIVPLITSGNVHSMVHYDTEIKLLSILPDFNLNHQLRVVNENFFINRRNLLLQNRPHSYAFRDPPGMGSFFIYAVLIFLIGELFLIYGWEDKNKRQALRNLFTCFTCRQVNAKLDHSSAMPTEEEALVRKEKSLVEDILRTNTQETYPLIVHNLCKFYDRKPAVSGLNFAVKKQECFGLLGVNGAGKTSTFQMISANSTISSGFIQIDGFNILNDEDKYKYRFGYCPQNDCLNHFMTSYQILKYIAMLRGVPNGEIHSEVISWLAQLDLLRYQNVCIRYYSGGTKRKLNAAIAMIGNPSLILLDEPTTGVDPVSRRFLWKCIQDFQKRDKTVVLTSHSMDECEQLCNRLAIMANGQFQCIGYVQDLKQKYGSGYTINIKMTGDCDMVEICDISQKLCNLFEDCELRENHAGMLTFYIKNETMVVVTWSNVFEKMEYFMNANEGLVQDYSINESTLEDIFLKFGKDSKRALSSCGDIVQN